MGLSLLDGGATLNETAANCAQFGVNMAESKVELELLEARRRIAEFEEVEIQRKQVDIASKDRDLLLDRMVDQSPYATWISDATGLLNRCDPALLRLLNATEEQLVGKYSVLDDPALVREGVMELVVGVFEEGKTASFDWEWSEEDNPAIKGQGLNSLELEATERLLGKGLAGFIQKPFNLATLTEKLTEVLQDSA